MWTSLRTAVTGLMAQQRALDISADNLTKIIGSLENDAATAEPSGCDAC